MGGTFDRLYRELGRATVLTLFAALGFLALSLLCALAGFARAVPSLNNVAAALGYVFAGLLALFLVTSLVVALVRYLGRLAAPRV